MRPDQTPARVDHRKPVRLAQAILTDVIDGRIKSAEQYLARLHDECGWDGIWLAVVAACDSFHAHACDGDMRPVTIRTAGMAIETGAITTDRSQLPARIDWAHRLLTARIAMDEQAFRAVQEEILALEESGPYIAALFETVGLTIRSTPRGYTLMGESTADDA